MEQDISQIRRDYAGQYLNEKEVGSDPLAFFEKWFDEALHAQLPEPNAMTLSTVGADGRPDARIVLLKGLEDGKFKFFTNYNSKKGRDLAANPYASLTFFWQGLERQVRISGPVSKCSAAESDAYFMTRPLKSRIGAWISHQSDPIPSRFYLVRKFAEYSLKNAGRTVTRPPFWGGYALQPEMIEFWQGRPSRLHDRIRFTHSGSSWQIERLSP